MTETIQTRSNSRFLSRIEKKNKSNGHGPLSSKHLEISKNFTNFAEQVKSSGRNVSRGESHKFLHLFDELFTSSLDAHKQFSQVSSTMTTEI